MNISRKHIKPDAPPQCIGRAIFRERLNEHQKCANGVVPGEQRRKDLPQPQREACAENGPAFLKAGGDIQHGVFQHGHEKWEHVQAHHQHQPAKAEKSLRPCACCREELLE